jgi:peroxiredoxin family protein
MSMDIMGIKKEELIDGVEFGGVASYLNVADSSGYNLFIDLLFHIGIISIRQ